MDGLNILIIGKSSFLAVNFFNYCILNGIRCKLVSLTEFFTLELSIFNVILNCSITNDYLNSSYDTNNDIDRLVINVIANLPVKYIMISSSKVYGNSLELKKYHENSILNPFDYHSENKIITENYIQSVLHNFIIFRGSNFFGDEYGRNSFFGYCLTNLKDANKIPVTINENIIRDFIHISYVCTLMLLAIQNNLTGIYNLSSGVGTSIGSIINDLIIGYNDGEKIIIDSKFDRQFILINKKLIGMLNVSLDLKDNIVFEIGKNLKRCENV